MERQMHKRKQVLSLDPIMNQTAIFTRKYADYIVPALRKIGMNKPSCGDDDLHSKFEQNVKHEVDMALALSAQEFAWSRFLRQKLSCPGDRTSSSWSPNQSSGFEETKILERSEERGEEEEEDREIGKRLKELQKLLPGGEEMGEEDTLSEIASYIVCLQLQMIILKSLVHEI